MEDDIGKKEDYERKKRRNLENEKENEKWT
jgi:hypothetical protein